jgi:hypothetical protein
LGGAILADLVPVALEWRLDLVVADAGELAGHIVAAQLGVPSVTKAFGALLDIYPPELQVQAAAHVPRRQLLRPVTDDGQLQTSSPLPCPIIRPTRPLCT